MEKILSIAIPTYNMEEYLPRCLNSLLENNYVITHLEIIIINDGSKDNSLKIAQDYQNKYPESIIIIDKKNGNYGSCINAALKIATGKYFKILDADDWYDSKALESFINEIKDLSVDMIFTAFQTVNSLNKILKQFFITPKIKKKNIISINDSCIKKLNPQTDLGMHGIAYRTQLLKDINYFQQEGISYTDMEYVYYPLAHVKSIIFFDLVLYQYYIGRTGQTISISSRIQHADDFLKIINRILKDSKLSNNKHTYYLQCEYLLQVITPYYHTLLVLQNLTKENQIKLKELDTRIKGFDTNLYNRLNSVKCKYIPYIKIWRKYNLSIIPSKVYRCLKKQ